MIRWRNIHKLILFEFAKYETTPGFMAVWLEHYTCIVIWSLPSNEVSASHSLPMKFNFTRICLKPLEFAIRLS